MNTYNSGKLPIYHLTKSTLVSLTKRLHASFLQEQSTKPQTPLSTGLSESVHSTLERDDFIAYVPAGGGKSHVYSFVQVRPDKRLLYV